MNAQVKMPLNELPTIGAALGGGFYAGQININGEAHALVVAPKASGETTGEYGKYGQDIAGAKSYSDGLANTDAMAETGSDLAKWARGLSIGGYTDWAIPARDQLELLYRNLKPSSDENLASFRDGDNPSSIPLGYPYTEEAPAQTTVEAFKEGGAEAFDQVWHFASTQSSAPSAWYQDFDDGSQGWYYKNFKGRARAVRMIPLGQ